MLSSNWYAPAYFGSGLRIGPIWSVHSGYGRWHYILKSNLPIQDSSRILDLGTNNGFYAMELLRRGAVEVIGVEPDETRVAQAQFVRAAFEWADNRTYNFRILHANMADVVSMDLGRFDMVIALCSIYYLEDDDISRVIRHVSGITDCFVWQCDLERGSEIPAGTP